MFEKNLFSAKKIFSFLSGKGGTGKTTIVANLGFNLALWGKKVLLVDMDFFTRGLTFYVTAGKQSFSGSIIDTLEKHKELELTQIRENLYLLPPSDQILDLTTTSEIEMLFDKQKKYFQEVLQQLKLKFDFILIDHRSGIDPLTISSALFSDGYIIITEEDRTSQRASHLLMNALKDESRKLTSERKGGIFLGFIINMYTTNYGSDLIKFLETSVFDGSCLAAIPHFSTVRKAFVKDEIMVKKYKNHYFSREIRVMSQTLSGLETPTAFMRAKRRQKGKLWIPMAVGFLSIYSYLEMGLVLSKEREVFDFISVLIPILPVIIFVIWLLSRKD